MNFDVSGGIYWLLSSYLMDNQMNKCDILSVQSARYYSSSACM